MDHRDIALSVLFPIGRKCTTLDQCQTLKGRVYKCSMHVQRHFVQLLKKKKKKNEMPFAGKQTYNATDRSMAIAATNKDDRQ